MSKLPRVALLTDNQTQAMALGELLRRHVVLTHAASLIEFKEHPEASQFDVLFCDWFFQNGAWKEVVEEVRARYCDLPVIIFSRIGGEREWVEVIEAGAFDLLSPPYREPLLLSAIKHATRWRQTIQWQTATQLTATIG